MLQGKKIAVIGGCGHVGLPLGVKFAHAGADTVLIDLNEEAIEKVNGGSFPFLERGGDEQLREALSKGLRATSRVEECASAEVIVFVIGTPVDEHLNPKLSEVLRIFDQYRPYFRPGVLVIMRSTLYPGTMQHLSERLKRSKSDVRFAFCPERVSQGYALDEIESLPQVVSAFDEESFQAAYDVFRSIAPKIIRLSPMEAEMAKLMANSWRYLEFAIANQFYMIAESRGVDFFKVFEAIRFEYPRAKGYKAPGLAAGPCLFKDTMQLASFFNNQFYLGHAAMLVNEGLATFMVERAAERVGGNLWGRKVGLLGMAFKADNDDPRESLSFKVKKGLLFHGATVLWHDPFITGGAPLEELLQHSEVILLCTPHSAYKSLSFEQPIVDVWDFYKTTRLEMLPGTEAVSGV